MPSVSTPQHNLMEARAHGATFPMAKAIPLGVAKDFAAADKGKSFKGAVRSVAKRQLAKKKIAQFRRAA
jgi:hypothetical protein